MSIPRVSYPPRFSFGAGMPPHQLPSETPTTQTTPTPPPQTTNMETRQSSPESTIIQVKQDDTTIQIMDGTTSEEPQKECVPWLRGSGGVNRLRLIAWSCFTFNLLVILIGCLVTVKALINVRGAYDALVDRDSRDIAAASTQVQLRLVEIESSYRGYVISNNSSYLRRYETGLPDITKHQAAMADRAGEDEIEAALAAHINQLVDQRKSQFASALVLFRDSGLEAIKKYMNDYDFESVTLDIDRSMSELVARADVLAARQHDRTREAFYILWVTLGVCWCCVVLSISIGVLGTGECNIRTLVSKNEALETLLEKAEESTRMKTVFLQNVSHEIRTPMNGVMAMAHLLQMTTLDDEQRECVTTIIDSSDAMIKLLNDLLLCSKIGSGRFSLNPAPFLLDRLVKHLRGVLMSRIQRKHALEQQANEDEEESEERSTAAEKQPQIAFHVILDARLPKCIIADEDRLRQILLNLIDKSADTTTNSIKFTSSGLITVQIRAAPAVALLDPSDPASRRSSKRRDRSRTRDIRYYGETRSLSDASPRSARATLKSTDQTSESAINAQTNTVAIEFSVRDTGKGIPIEMREKIFEAFTQGDMSSTKQYGGTGLGLTVCGQLVHQMHSSIRVESDEGHGSAFTFTIVAPIGSPEQIQQLNIFSQTRVQEEQSTPMQEASRIKTHESIPEPSNEQVKPDSSEPMHTPNFPLTRQLDSPTLALSGLSRSRYSSLASAAGRSSIYGGSVISIGGGASEPPYLNHSPPSSMPNTRRASAATHEHEPNQTNRGQQEDNLVNGQQIEWADAMRPMPINTATPINTAQPSNLIPDSIDPSHFDPCIVRWHPKIHNAPSSLLASTRAPISEESVQLTQLQHTAVPPLPLQPVLSMPPNFTNSPYANHSEAESVDPSSTPSASTPLTLMSRSIGIAANGPAVIEQYQQAESGSTHAATRAVSTPAEVGATEKKKKKTPAPAKSKLNSGRGLHILCAEDNLTNQKVIRRLLVREGHTVVMADNGAIAVDLFKAHSSEFDCILLDVCMPVCDGVQACRLIRELEMKRNRMSDTAMTPTPAPAQGSSALPYSLTLERGETEPLPNRVERIPIVAVTASALLDDKRACVDAGMDDVLTKPLTPAGLSRILNLILARRHTATLTDSALSVESHAAALTPTTHTILEATNEPNSTLTTTATRPPAHADVAAAARGNAHTDARPAQPTDTSGGSVTASVSAALSAPPSRD